MELVRAGVLSVVLIGGVFGLGRLLAIGVRRIGWFETRLESTVTGCRSLFTMVSVFGAFAVHAAHFRVPGLRAVLPSGPVGTVAWIAVVVTVTTATAVAAVTAFHRGFRPAVEAVINPEFEIDERDRRRGTIAAVGGIALFVLTPYAAIALPIPWEWVMVACYGGGVILWIGYVQSVQTLPPTGSPLRFTVIWAREPTADERERLERCYDRFDRSLGRPMIVRSERLDGALYVIGRGDDRLLWLREPLLEAASDDELAVALAKADEAMGALRPMRAARYVFVLLFLGLSAVAFEIPLPGTTPEWLLLGGAAVLLIAVLVWRTRQIIYRADDFASRELGADSVYETYRRLGLDIAFYAVQDADDPGRGRDAKFSVFVPTVSKRLDRLVDRNSLEGVDAKPTPQSVLEAPDDSDGDSGTPADELTADPRGGDDATGAGRSRTAPDASPGTGAESDATELIARLESLSEDEFVRFVADCWEAVGWDCTRSWHADEPGTDVKATRHEPDVETAAIQAIRATPSGVVGPDEIRAYDDLERQVAVGSVDSVVLVTTGRFASEIAARTEKRNITLVDGDELAALAEQVGAAERPTSDSSGTSESERADAGFF
ncbi:restriction endonuclease [Natrinema amylolyticum]|uniref:restriction endonuclease n=1 Tax=Natrinema amylolyticum TaxID=2878679 RepID=UPI001CFA8158|nr:restriction endonuclease [Natrinema amylolyticum]